MLNSAPLTKKWDFKANSHFIHIKLILTARLQVDANLDAKVFKIFVTLFVVYFLTDWWGYSEDLLCQLYQPDSEPFKCSI